MIDHVSLASTRVFPPEFVLWAIPIVRRLLRLSLSRRLGLQSMPAARLERCERGGLLVTTTKVSGPCHAAWLNASAEVCASGRRNLLTLQAGCCG